jgi:hypothetical protein
LGVLAIAAAAHFVFVSPSFRIRYHAMRSSRMVGVVIVVVYRVEVDFGKWRSALAYVQYLLEVVPLFVLRATASMLF